MNTPSLKERFMYWFDNQMAKGSGSLIKLLTLVTIAVISVIVLIGIITGLAGEDGLITFVWDSIATIINAWWPYFDDGEGSIGYLVLMGAGTICGLLLTSVLIGIVSSAIEEKITALRRGNSRVLEKDHTIVLGFHTGEYTLLRQLILAAGDNNECIVVADDTPQEEMEEEIRDNIEIPKNIRLICRTINIYDPTSLEKCSLSTSRNILISPTNDKDTVMILLAVSKIINAAENDRVHVGAVVSHRKYQFPPSVAKKHNVITLKTNDILAKIIAHSCAQPRLSETFREIFNFEGSELYTLEASESIGMTFAQITRTLDLAVPLGFIRNGKVMINPGKDEKCRKGDRVLIFAEDRNKYRFIDDSEEEPLSDDPIEVTVLQDAGLCVILGYNETLPTVLRELPENVTNVLTEGKKKFRETLKVLAEEKMNRRIKVYDRDIEAEGALLAIAKEADHIILLSDHEMEADDADLKVIFRIMNLRDIRTRYNLNFNITAEMRCESNQALIEDDDHIDFVVASNMSSLFLVQLAESPELDAVFAEILSNEGNEFYLRDAADLHCIGTNNIRYWRNQVMLHGYVMIGYIKEDGSSVFNPPLYREVEFTEKDRLIVLGLS